MSLSGFRDDFTANLFARDKGGCYYEGKEEREFTHVQAAFRLADAAARSAAVAATAPTANEPATRAPVIVPAAAAVLVAVAVEVATASVAKLARNPIVLSPKMRLMSRKRLKLKTLTSTTAVMVTPREATSPPAIIRAGRDR